MSHPRPPQFQSKRLAAAAGVLGVWLLICSAVQAQQEELPLLEPSPPMATRLRWLQYTMISGRIVASSSHVTNITVPRSTTLGGRREERQTLNINYAVTNVDYELSTPIEQLTLSIAESWQFVVHRARNDGKYVLDFEQVPDAPLVLSLQESGVKRSWRAESFWHLCIAEPEVVRQHLVPILEMLHPMWQLAAMSSGIEECLFRRAQSQEQPDRQRWARLVADLASPRFAERQNAERELYKAGQAVVPYLQNLDRSRLDAEQTYRVRSLVDSLAVGYEDTVDRIVIWLSGDEQVWLSLLSRTDSQKRRVAAEQLAQVLGTPIDFDPAASDEVRASQLERLKARLTRAVPPAPKSAAPAKPRS